MIRFKSFLNEAFSKGTVDRARKLIVKVLEKRIGKLAEYPDVVEFMSGGKRKTGLRYFTKDAKSIRFNWTTKHGSEIESIDIWNGKTRDPNINVNTKGKNIIQIIDVIVELVKNPKIGKIDFKLDESLQEAKAGRKLAPETQEFLNKEGISIEEFRAKRSKFQAKLNRFKKEKLGIPVGKPGRPKKDMFGSIEVTKGKPEHDLDPDIKKAEKIKPRISASDLFKDLEELTKTVISGATNALMVGGSGGVGKSFTIKDVIKKSGLVKGKDWQLLKGGATAFGLYSVLFQNRDGLVLLDDFDSALTDKDQINMLKAALDTDDEREISWISKNTVPASVADPEDFPEELLEKGRLPQQFEFRGQVIFVFNLPFSKLSGALKTRALKIEINLTEDEARDRMNEIGLLPTFGGKKVKLNMKDRKEVLEHIKKNFDGEDLNMRVLVHGMKLKQSGANNWKLLVSRYA